MITRQDLAPGYQGVQAQHGLTEFIFQHPDIAQAWYKQSNYLGFLSVTNEAELKLLIEKAAEQGIIFSVFKEPDIDNEITAIALEPGTKSKKLCSRLQLGLKEYNGGD